MERGTGCDPWRSSLNGYIDPINSAVVFCFRRADDENAKVQALDARSASAALCRFNEVNVSGYLGVSLSTWRVGWCKGRDAEMKAPSNVCGSPDA
jgi:hypothetical protein